MQNFHRLLEERAGSLPQMSVSRNPPQQSAEGTEGGLPTTEQALD